MKKNVMHLFTASIVGLAISLGSTSCSKDEKENDNPTPMRSMTYSYGFNNGQVVPTASYGGNHKDDLTAEMKVEELGENSVKISVTLANTVQGEMYMIHAHDAADASTTPNGTPYNETPNGEVFSQMVNGNGGTVTVSQTISGTYSFITEQYAGFFVVHDPFQSISTSDISTYLVVGGFARVQPADNSVVSNFIYDFNTGQLVPAFAYAGMHPNDLGAKLSIRSLPEGSRVSVELMNAVNGQMYHVHAHDMADPATTPNGTPYIETPNSDVLSLHVMVQKSKAFGSQLSSMSAMELTKDYEAFFVVHDPMQAISTTDPTTYVILGVFGRN